MCSQMEFQRRVLGEAKFPVYILQGANDLGQVRELITGDIINWSLIHMETET